MTETKSNSDDEELYRLLSEKLHRHYCGDEGSQLSDQEIEAVLAVMDMIKLPYDSYFNADAAWERFQKRYLSAETTENADISVEISANVPVDGSEEFSAELVPEVGVSGLPGLADLIGTMERDIKAPAGLRRVLRSRAVRWTAIAVSAAAVMFAGLNVGTYATAKMGFFEFLSKNGNSWEFFITGERENESNVNGDFEIGSVTKREFQSWEEVKEATGEQNLLVPAYLPEEFVLSSLVISKSEDQDVVTAIYSGEDDTNFQIRTKQYVTDDRLYNMFCAEEDYSEKTLSSGRTMYYSLLEDETTAWFLENGYSYYVDGEVSLEEIEQIVENMK